MISRERMGKRRREAGFTLIEVMVALFIFSVAALTLLAARSQTVRMNEEVRLRLRMVDLANMKLAEIVARGFAPPGTLSGRFKAPYHNYRWIEEVSPSPIPIVRQVRLTVRHGKNSEARSFSLVTYVSNIP
ncbi:MAG: prepilin-type N-terminal cleavage/methylation domain-containing protein [Nitrospirae bacterium]|nr:prepilin-type N-terminal cleavage/methylation domain-containing protein [Nitrospirota bacterium]